MSLLILPEVSGDAATNMAIDASLLISMPEGSATFRHYEWTEPSATFGYTQKWCEAVALFPEKVQLCRRMTGGGILDHRNDWTYAFALEASLANARIKATTLYEQLHHGLAQAIREIGIATKLAPCPNKRNATNRYPNQCFLAPVKNDVLTIDGTKIAGAAMKRTRKGILIQGSVNRPTLPEDFDYTLFAKKFTQQLSNILKLPIGKNTALECVFDPFQIQAERNRFKSKEWTRKR